MPSLAPVYFSARASDAGSITLVPALADCVDVGEEADALRTVAPEAPLEVLLLAPQAPIAITITPQAIAAEHSRTHFIAI